MPPERRLRIRDPLGELLVSAADVLPKVRAGKIRAPATFACVRDLTKDAGEVAQGVLPALESVRRRLELTGQNLVLIVTRGVTAARHRKEDDGSAPRPGS
jgi:hypothetical protein